MCGGVDVCAILDLHCVLLALHQSPKLALDVRLAHESIVQHPRCRTGLGGQQWPVGVVIEPRSSECLVPSLEARQRMFLSFIEAEIIAVAQQTRCAVPLICWDLLQRRIEAKGVKAFRLALSQCGAHLDRNRRITEFSPRYCPDCKFRRPRISTDHGHHSHLPSCTRSALETTMIVRQISKTPPHSARYRSHGCSSGSLIPLCG